MELLNTFHKGVQAAQFGNPICARVYFERALNGQSDNPDLWVWLASTAYSPAEALEFLNTASNLAPDNKLVEAYRLVISALNEYECANPIAARGHIGALNSGEDVLLTGVSTAAARQLESVSQTSCSEEGPRAATTR